MIEFATENFQENSPKKVMLLGGCDCLLFCLLFIILRPFGTRKSIKGKRDHGGGTDSMHKRGHGNHVRSLHELSKSASLGEG